MWFVLVVTVVAAGIAIKQGWRPHEVIGLILAMLVGMSIQKCQTPKAPDSPTIAAPRAPGSQGH